MGTLLKCVYIVGSSYIKSQRLRVYNKTETRFKKPDKSLNM